LICKETVEERLMALQVRTVRTASAALHDTS
jgi:hypothetical protein